MVHGGLVPVGSAPPPYFQQQYYVRRTVFSLDTLNITRQATAVCVSLPSDHLQEECLKDCERRKATELF